VESNLASSILRICQALNQHDIQYMMVGGAAVALHGYFRHSVNLAGIVADKPDLDFWYNPTYGNYFKLLDALGALGQDVTRYRKEKTPNPKKSFFKYEFEHFTLDLLPVLKAPLQFTAAFASKEFATLNGVLIPFIGYDDLLFDKQAAARPKDLTDIEQLRKKRGLNNQ